MNAIFAIYGSFITLALPEVKQAIVELNIYFYEAHLLAFEKVYDSLSEINRIVSRRRSCQVY